jgi:hypothetical protein
VFTSPDVSEALFPLRYLDTVFVVLFGLLTVFIGATLVSSFSAQRLRRRRAYVRVLDERAGF